MDIHSSQASTSSSLTSCRRKWSLEDEAIERAFAKYDKVPSKNDIRMMFQTDNVLPEIKEGNTFARCYEKVKNIFKKQTSD